MDVLAFDGRMGASGDMLLGALVAAGADPDALAPVEDALGVHYAVGETTKNGIRATTVDVLLEGGRPMDDHAERGPIGRSEGESAEPSHQHVDDHARPQDHDRSTDHRHDHPREHDHHHEADQPHRQPHEHDHSPGPGHGNTHDDHDQGRRHAEGAGAHRSYPEVVDIVAGMGLPDAVEADALAVFERLGEAEAAVHGTDLESTHFHEVGADDAVADVVGAALLLADIDPDRVVTTPLATGGGEVSMSHGRYPVPPPAVVEIAGAADWSIRGGPVEEELLTPTGAAILAHVAEGVESLPPLRVRTVGYGAGDRDFPEHPNVLRAIVGDGGSGLVRDEIRVLETNVDDVSPEVLGELQETVTEAGARDVSVVPLSMKKSRPGHLVKVIVKPEDAPRVARRLAEETGTLGVREAGARHRWIARRRFETATVSVDGVRQEVAVKVASDEDGTVYDVSAEYEDAADVARRSGLPVREVARRAETAVRQGGALSPVLVHVVEAERWRAVEDRGEGRYEPPSLSEEGFVHLSPPERAVGVAQYNYPDAEAPLLLVVEPDRIEPTVKYEEGDDGAFPHVYGPLNADAVVDVLEFPREGGRYWLPDGLSEWTDDTAA